MATPQHGSEGAIWFTVALVVAILLGWRLGLAGLIIGLVVAGIAFVGYRRTAPNPELEALRASLRMARDDIAQVLEEFSELADGSSTDAIAARVLHYPALLQADSPVPEIQDFHLRVAPARRFIGRVDKHLRDDDLDRHSLERLIILADQRATDLEVAWLDARRAAQKHGPAA